MATGPDEAIAMTTTSVRCRVGLHAWVRRHPPDERLEGPDHQVCRSCGKQRDRGSALDLPPGFLSGGGPAS